MIENQEIGTYLSKNEDGTWNIQLNLDNPLSLELIKEYFDKKNKG